jgi:GTP pyrophosphokinase
MIDAHDHPATHDALARLLVRSVERGLDRAELERCAHWAIDAHGEQRRRSGEPYVTHPLEVAGLVTDLGGSTAMVQAAILHDTVEDTDRTLADVTRHFGAEVAGLVDGCTKVAVVHPDADRAQRHAANLRKLFVAMAADPRVVVVKLCDRLHNLRTIAALPADKARRIGEETLAVHAPLAHRMGLGALKAELEDRAYAAADRRGYLEISERIAASDLHQRLADAQSALRDHLNELGMSLEISGRVKHVWSMRRKAQRHGVDPLELPDVLGLRVLCDDVEQCFAVLAAVHALWAPDLTRLRDYINRPKSNGYQSLHTTVTTPHGRLEVQVRTRGMHDAAEHGTAAHHSYKHPGEEPRWVERLVAWAGEDLSDEEYVDGVHATLDTRRDVLVMTPQGDVIELPEGSCTIDFAYAIHSQIGDRCVGAKIDGRIVALQTRLRNGQRVEILTGQRDGPSPEWLDWVATPRARAKIRAQHLKLRNTGDAVTAMPSAATPPSVVAVRERRTTAGMQAAIAGLHGVEMHLGGCCTPQPPCHLAGLVNRTRVTIHRSDCPVLGRGATSDPGRRVPAHWVIAGHEVLTLTLDVGEHPGLHAAIASCVGGAGGEVLAIDRIEADRLLLSVASRSEQRRSVRAALRLVAGVRAVH